MDIVTGGGGSNSNTGWGWRLWQRSRRPRSADSDDTQPKTPGPGPGPNPGPRPRPDAVPDNALEPTLLSPSDIGLIARLVKAEAEGEPYDGQVAIAAVILNRLKSPLFPNDARSIIYQPRQFEPVSNGRINQPAQDIHRQAVEDALAGKDPTNGALFFFNPARTSNAFMHSLPVTVRIGQHSFA